MFRTFVLFVVVISVVMVASHEHDRKYYEERFYDHMKKFNLKPKSGRHFVQMLHAFADNDDFIEAHNNAGTHSYTLGHNGFSHMTNMEYRRFLNLESGVTSRPKADRVHDATTAADESIDWVEKGAVTDVKDQGQCGSCWAFSTTGSIEGAFFLKTGNLQSFSEQQFVDCDDVDHGCNGGLMDQAFQWAKDNGGVAREEDYKYKGVEEKCNTAVKSIAGAAPQSYTDVEPNSDDTMTSALTQQPVSIGIDAARLTFQLYGGGVYDDPLCGTNLNHGVLAVGYGKNDVGKDYYKVKNSWGPYWGNHGYILLARGGDVNNDKGGQCGMLKQPSYPNL